MDLKDKSRPGKLWFGVDWGTHSSKWICYQEKAEMFLAGEIHRSTLTRIANRLLFPRGEDIPKGDERIDALKGTIIKDPLGQSFWDADRGDTHSSLGEAVSFSFCALFSDIVQHLRQKGIEIVRDAHIEIGFSLPNWLRDRDNKSKAALMHFHQAAIVSCWILKRTYGGNLPSPGKSFLIKEWKDVIKNALNECKSYEIWLIADKLTETLFQLGNIEWRYLVESCAAGLPYLRSIINLIERDAPPGLHGLGKLLVIDVGAGSTDVGYMLRTINIKELENLCYFPPAGTFDVAGNELTERLWDYYRQQGKRLTQAEAENSKIRETGWHKLEFANEWRRQIRRHVTEYVIGIPDERWLPLDVPLQIVVTGGSGVVPVLKEEIRKGVRDGLKERRIPSRVIERTKLINDRIPRWDFKQEAEYARRAVSIGAADTNKPALKYCPRLGPPIKIQPGIIKY